MAPKLTSIRWHPAIQDILELISSTTDGALAIDREQRIVLWNKAAEMLLGFKAEEVIGKLCFEVFGGTNELGCLACHKACLDVSFALRQELVPTRDLG
jgi:PAS domain S-box-containing protein